MRRFDFNNSRPFPLPNVSFLFRKKKKKEIPLTQILAAWPVKRSAKKETVHREMESTYVTCTWAHLAICISISPGNALFMGVVRRRNRSWYAIVILVSPFESRRRTLRTHTYTGREGWKREETTAWDGQVNETWGGESGRGGIFAWSGQRGAKGVYDSPTCRFRRDVDNLSFWCDLWNILENINRRVIEMTLLKERTRSTC